MNQIASPEQERENDLDHKPIPVCLVSSSLRKESPSIGSLPDELLVSIFIVGIPVTLRVSWERYTVTSYANLKAPRWEVLLSHVNRHWRQVALDTPALWTKISRSQLQQSFDWQSAYICRSGVLPFYLKIDIRAHMREEGDGDEDGEVMAPDQQDDIGPFLRFITPHLHRCQYLYLKSKGRYYEGYFSEGVRAAGFLSSVHAPMLKALRVSIGNFPPLEREPIRIVQDSACSLTHLDLKNTSFFWLNPPTENITYLRLSPGDWPQHQSEYQRLRDALHAMPRLCHLDVQPTSRRNPWPSNLSMKLPSLRRLVCRYYHAFFLSAIEAPLLEDLALQITGTVTVNNATGAVLPMYCNTNLASVRKLHLSFTNNDFAISAMHSLAQAFPFLTQLSCRLLSMFPAPCDILVNVYDVMRKVDPLHGQLWPHVTTLDLCEPYTANFPSNALRTLLVRRADVGYPIQTITLPKNQLDEGLAMSELTEPRVQVLENAYVEPRSYTPRW